MSTYLRINNQNVPLPATYSETVSYRAAYYVGADAMTCIDTREGTNLTYRDVTLSWEDITEAEMKTIRGAWQVMTEEGQVPFTDPMGIEYTAEVMPGGKSFDCLAYVGQRAGSGMFEALFRASFQARLS